MQTFILLEKLVKFETFQAWKIKRIPSVIQPSKYRKTDDIKRMSLERRANSKVLAKLQTFQGFPQSLFLVESRGLENSWITSKSFKTSWERERNTPATQHCK